MALAQAYQPIKAYEVTNSGTFTTRHLELRHNGATFLWINTHSGFLQSTQVSLQKDSQNGPIVAAARLKSMGSGCRVFVGNPDATPKEQWLDVESQSLSNKQYGFWCQGTNFAWKRTHKKELGASGWKSGDFKLINPSMPDQILAVYVTGRKWFNNTDIARVEFMVELGTELELTSLAAMLGIAEHMSRSRRSGASADVAVAAC